MGVWAVGRVIGPSGPDSTDSRAVWRRGRVALLAVCVLLAFAGIAVGYNLTVSAGRRQAAVSVKFMTHFVPRATGYRLGRCVAAGRGRVRCPYSISIRALSGGAIVCTSTVFVTEPKHGSGNRKRAPALPISTFAKKISCVRRAPAARAEPDVPPHERRML